MKKYILALCALLTMCCYTTTAQSVHKEQINGITVLSVEKANNTDNHVKTSFQYKDSGGVLYNIWVNKSNGRCYIYRTSKKTGKQYKYYLPESICLEVCNEMGLKYIKPEKKV